ncbi:arabinogalactan endo-1,4-beta-galactosidase [Diplocarpon rosae]|nr:arabinogalactan endo-1,4-beta-galactosidase [Diplocarpon rosae]
MLPSAVFPLLFAGVQAALTFKGVDWSSLLVEEAAGITYKTTGNVTVPLEQILVASGVNTVRQRLWVNPPDGNYNLEYNLKLAKRAQAVGLSVYLNLHFSDSWADPTKQVSPAAWPIDIGDLLRTVYQYTLDVSNAFAAANIPLPIISIGNEITQGLLFPTGAKKSFYNLASILHAASAGIKDSHLTPKPQIMIHLDNGWKWDVQEAWYTSALAAGPLSLDDFDIMAVSHYPFYNQSATLDKLETSLNNLASTWGKSIMLVETDWPVACPSPKHPFPVDVSDIPFSAEGQTIWMRKLAAIVASISRGDGLFYWEPMWINNPGLGSSCADNLMVDPTGVVRSSLEVFSSI